MKKYARKFFFLLIAFVFIVETIGAGTYNAFAEGEAAEESTEPTTNYFLIGKNNFEDNQITKGVLDQQVGPIRSPREVEDSTLTYHQFYMKYNYGPEMTNANSSRNAFNPYNYKRLAERPTLKGQLFQYDENGNPILDVNTDTHLEYESTDPDKVIIGNNLLNDVMDSNTPEVPNSFLPHRKYANSAKNAIKPLFFTYLYVGDHTTGQTNNYQFTKDFLIPDSIDYNETNKLSDYMLSGENNIVIPTRYNVVRDDITLLLRSRTELEVGKPQVNLEVKDEEGVQLKGSVDNPKKFIDTTIAFHLIPFAYNHVSSDGMQTYKSVVTANNGQTVGVDKFNSTVNSRLNLIALRSSQTIIRGVSGGVLLKGFYRDGIEDIETSNAKRLEDRKEVTNVKYYLKQTNFRLNTDGVGWTDEARNAEIDGIKELLSPEVSKFKIETTRPTITTNQPLTFDYNPETSDFEQLLGNSSINVADEGVSNFADASGQPEKVGVNVDNVRVRIQEVGTNSWSAPMAVAALENAIQDYAGKQVHVLYTYSAVDAEAGNIEKLPEEIADNTGAYAIPLQKTVNVAEKPKGSVVIKYVDEENNVLWTDTKTGNVGTNDSHTAQETITVDGIEYQLNDEEEKTFTYVEEDGELIFKYKAVTGDITVKYVSGENVLFENKKTETVGKDFTHEAPATYEKDGVTYELVTTPSKVDGAYTKEAQTFTFEYKEKVVTGDITVKYVSGENVLFETKTTETVGKDFTHEAPATYEKDGVTYELVTTPATVDGAYTKEAQTFTFEYKAVTGDITVKYVSGENVLFETKKTETVGKDFTHEAPATYEKDGVTYELVTTPATVDGAYTKEAQTFTFEYKEKVVTGDITVKYVSGENVLFETKKTETVGKDFTHEAPATYEKDGVTYELVTTPSKVDGAYTKEAQTFTFEYKAVTGDITVKYVSGENVLFENKKTETVGKDFTHEAPATYEKDGVTYELVTTPATVDGAYTKEAQTFTFEYKERSVVEQGTVTVRYVDTDGNVLYTAPLLTDDIGKAYTTTAPKTYTYENVTYTLQKVPKNAEGVYAEGNTNVDYVYEKVRSSGGSNPPKDSDTKEPIKSTIPSKKVETKPAIIGGGSSVPTTNSGNLTSATPNVVRSVTPVPSGVGTTTSVPQTVVKDVPVTKSVLPQTGESEINKILALLGIFSLVIGAFIYRRRIVQK